MTQAVIYGLLLASLLVSLASDRTTSSQWRATFLRSVVRFWTAVAFALALRLSTLYSPTKVLSFLITPFPDSRIFDPTLLFLAVGALPTSIALYQLAIWLRSNPNIRRLDYKGGRENIVPSYGAIALTEFPQSRLLSSKAAYPPLIAEKDNWTTDSAQIDRRLLLGAVVFGVGWGLEGICPGPALVNVGISVHHLLTGGFELGSMKWFVWLLGCILGGYVAG